MVCSARITTTVGTCREPWCRGSASPLASTTGLAPLNPLSSQRLPFREIILKDFLLWEMFRDWKLERRLPSSLGIFAPRESGRG